MRFDTYQYAAIQTAVYPERMGMMYTTLGLTGEAGELANKVKKIVRDKDGVWDVEDRKEIKDELGDVLWYVAMVAKEFDLSLDSIAEANIEKLKDRQERGVLQGSGDSR